MLKWSLSIKFKIIFLINKMPKLVSNMFSFIVSRNLMIVWKEKKLSSYFWRATLLLKDWIGNRKMKTCWSKINIIWFKTTMLLAVNFSTDDYIPQKQFIVDDFFFDLHRCLGLGHSFLFLMLMMQRDHISLQVKVWDKNDPCYWRFFQYQSGPF